MFNFLKRSDRQPVASAAVAPVSVSVEDAYQSNNEIPRLLRDDYDIPYVPFTEALTEENMEAALKNLMDEVGGLDYDRQAGIDAIQTPMERVSLIVKAMNYMMDGDSNGEDFSKHKANAVELPAPDDDDSYWDEEDEDEEMEVTFASLNAFLQERKDTTITPQEYLDGWRFSFSV